jgi:nucleoside-diphosphate-sugar epimerase
MRILVTGAGGFLGAVVCRALLEGGHAVRGLVRRQRSGLPADTVAGDLSDQSSLDRAVMGMDAVVHLAARVHVMQERNADPLAAFRRVNVEGTARLLDAARDAGVRRFVFVSSVKAVGESSTAPLNSRSMPRPVDPYGISKREAEVIVASRRTSELAIGILRPPLIYGPGMGGNMLRLFHLVDRGFPLPLAGLDNRRSIAYVGNVASAITHLLAADRLAGPALFVSDGEDLSTEELIVRIARSLGRPARLVSIPRPLRRLGRALAAAASRLGHPQALGALDRLGGSLQVDGEELGAATGFVRPYTMAEGLAATAAWVRAPGARR